VEVESRSKHVVYKRPRVHVREECDGEDDSIRTDATEMAQRDVLLAEISEGAIEIGEVGTVLLGIEADDSAGEEPDLADDEGGPGQDDASKDEESDSFDEDSPSPLQVEEGRLNLEEFVDDELSELVSDGELEEVPTCRLDSASP
jgi:hypothetical protein